MAVLKCKKCGRQTNSVVSEYMDVEEDGFASECYAAFVDGKWVKGCAYDKLGESIEGVEGLTKKIADELIEVK